jgi:hypothetical protein
MTDTIGTIIITCVGVKDYDVEGDIRNMIQFLLPYPHQEELYSDDLIVRYLELLNALITLLKWKQVTLIP